MAEIEFSALPETACRNAKETTWHWLELSTPMRSDATPPGPPSTGVSAPMLPAPNCHRLYPRDSWIDPVLALRPPAYVLKPVDRRHPDRRRGMPLLSRGEPLPGERRMVNGRPARQIAPDRVKRRRGRPLPAAREHQQVLGTGAGRIELTHADRGLRRESAGPWPRPRRYRLTKPSSSPARPRGCAVATITTGHSSPLLACMVMMQILPLGRRVRPRRPDRPEPKASSTEALSLR